MATEWPRMTIQALIDAGAIVGHKDGNHGSMYPRVEEFGSEGVPFLTAKNLSAGNVDIEGAPRLADEKADALRIGFVRPNDVLLSHNATVGRVAVMPEFEGRILIGTSLTYFRTDPSQLEPRYLAAFFTGRDFQNQLAAVMSQTTRNQVPITSQRTLSAVVPPLPEQRAIARILGTLDDKIELNRRMNATLEAMARALFQSWFVDFDPVHAKAAGRYPSGMDASTAALFPTSFQDSELGAIPAGWNAVPLYDTAQWVNGAAFKTSDFCASGEGLPVIKIAELKDGIGSQTKWSQREAPPEKTIDTGDLLYSWSGSPETSLEAFLWSGGRGLLNQHIFKVISSTAAEKRFVYYLLQFLRPVLVETAKNKQTTGLGHVTIADMKRLLVCIPDKAVLAAFDRIVAPMFDRAFNNTLESRTLAALRDTLLPKLLSGEIGIPTI